MLETVKTRGIKPPGVYAATLLLLCAGQARAAVDPNAMMLSVGLGSVSCATWLSDPGTERAGGQWALGFFTGADQFSAMAGGDGMVGHSTDQLGIIGEIRKVCQDQPSTSLIGATGMVYFKMQKAGR